MNRIPTETVERAPGIGAPPGSLPALVGLCLVLCLQTAAFGQTGRDSIFLTDGPPLHGIEILDEGCDQVAYKQANTRQTVSSDQVASVKYGNRPTRFSMAVTNMRVGKPAKAVEDLDYIINSAGDKTPAWILPHALHLKVKALLQMAQGDPSRYDEAAKTFQTFLADKANAKHRLAPYVMLHLGEALVGADEVAEAKDAYKKLANLNCPGPWDLHGKLGEGLILIKEGNYSDARSVLEDVIQKSAGKRGTEGLHARARTLMGQAWLAEESFDNAITQFEKLATAGSDEFARSGAISTALASAYNGMGDSYRMRADRFGDKKDYKDAVLSYLRVVVLFSEPPAERRHALLWGGRCCDKVGWGDKAKDLYRDLKANYPGSEEAKQAAR